MACFKIISRLFTTSTNLQNVFNHVTVVGGGLMGSGIAQVTAQAGMDVTVVELDDEAVKKSDSYIKNNMHRVAKKLFQNSSTEAEKYLSQTMGRLKISTNLPEVVAQTDLVVEAIVENIGAKHKLFSQIDSVAPEHTIFASNTSSIPITEIASVTTRKDRFGGLHFFNPVPVMKLLEVIRTEETSDDTYQKMINWGKAIGKTCITCKDTPGFVVNRLLVPYLAEAVRMLERDVASPKDIDIAMKLGAGYPMGPLELLDYVGLDTTKFILDGWYNKFPGNPLFAPIPLLNKLVGEGKLGKKTGEGFYSYKKNNGAFSIPVHSPYFQPLPSAVKRALASKKMSEEALQKDAEKSGGKGPVNFIVEKGLKTEQDLITPSFLTKLKNQEKMKKLLRLKNLEKWKNSEEFLYQRDKLAGLKRTTKPKRMSKLENYTPWKSEIICREWEKLRENYSKRQQEGTHVFRLLEKKISDVSVQVKFLGVIFFVLCILVGKLYIMV